MLDTIWGHGEDLGVVQMATRAFVLFFVALVLVRIAGMRAFGRKSSFDTIVAVLLGAILSRAVYGASDTLPIIAACAVLVFVHRMIAIATARWPTLERLAKGAQVVVYANGAPQYATMQRHGVSHADLLEIARREIHRADLDEVSEIRMETSGELTVIRKPKT